MSKPRLPEFDSDEEAEDFVADADLRDYDLSGAKPRRFQFAPDPYRFEIYRDAEGHFRARFRRGEEIIFTTEAFPSEAKAKSAMQMFTQNGPAVAGTRDGSAAA